MVHVGFVVGAVALGTVYCRVLQLTQSVIPPCSRVTYHQGLVKDAVLTACLAAFPALTALRNTRTINPSDSLATYKDLTKARFNAIPPCREGPFKPPFPKTLPCQHSVYICCFSTISTVKWSNSKTTQPVHTSHYTFSTDFPPLLNEQVKNDEPSSKDSSTKVICRTKQAPIPGFLVLTYWTVGDRQ